MKVNKLIEKLEREDDIIAECSDLINLLISSRKIESEGKPYIVEKLNTLERLMTRYKIFLNKGV